MHDNPWHRVDEVPPPYDESILTRGFGPRTKVMICGVNGWFDRDGMPSIDEPTHWKRIGDSETGVR